MNLSSHCDTELHKAGLIPNIMVDCSHANSNKNHELQPLVVDNVTHQILDGNKSIIDIMVESNLKASNQKILDDHSQMEYGVSVTDKCIDWETTESLLMKMAEQLREPLKVRNS